MPLPKRRITESVSQHFNQCTQLKFIVLSTSTFFVCLKMAIVMSRSLLGLWSEHEPLAYNWSDTTDKQEEFYFKSSFKRYLSFTQVENSLKQRARFKLTTSRSTVHADAKPSHAHISLLYYHSNTLPPQKGDPPFKWKLRNYSLGHGTTWPTL